MNIKKYHFFTIVFIALSIFSNKTSVAQMPVTSILNNAINYQNSQKKNVEYTNEDKPDTYLFDPGRDDEFYFTDTKRAAEKHAANLLKKAYNALKNETTNKKVNQTKVKGITVFAIKPGKFYIEKNKNKSTEFVGTFWQFKCKIGEDYVFVSEENAKYDLSSGRFHYSNAGAGQFADFRLIQRMENMLIQMLKDMNQLK